VSLIEPIEIKLLMQLTIKKHRPGKNQYAVHKATFKNLLFRNNLQAEENVL
jgi:hypothetical protein